MNVVFVRGDDWEGLYVNGILELEGHSLRGDDVARCLEAQVEVHYIEKEETWDKIVALGCDNLPDKLEDVVWDS